VKVIDFWGSGVIEVVLSDLARHDRNRGRTMKNIADRIKELPPELQQEVEDFIEFLKERRLGRPRGKPTFSWAGALRDLREKYTSVELQHKISEWRIGEK